MAAVQSHGLAGSEHGPSEMLSTEGVFCRSKTLRIKFWTCCVDMPIIKGKSAPSPSCSLAQHAICLQRALPQESRASSEPVVACHPLDPHNLLSRGIMRSLQVQVSCIDVGN
eukprot:scaffold58421_cov23-Tisochrysis_lutea.AAC.1